MVEEYYNNLMDKYSDGKMEKEDFIATFHLAFPSRPQEKLDKLAEELANKDGKICKFFFFLLLLGLQIYSKFTSLTIEE